MSYVMAPRAESAGKFSESPVSGSGKGKTIVKVCHGHPWLMKDGTISHSDCANITDVCVLGTGLTGTVRLGKWSYGKKSLYVAMKGISKDYILKHHDERHINNEKQIMSISASPFIIRLFGTFQDEDCIYFNMEFAMGGELFSYLNTRRNFPVEMARFYGAEIFLALEHVQNHGFVYRDLKPENVMLDEAGHCKLVDFGFATQPNQQGMMVTNCGTPAYLSPEQLNLKFTKGYTKVVDWWSLGCVIFELMAGLTPFNKTSKDSEYEVYTRVLQGSINFPGGFDPVAKEFVKELLHTDLKKRKSDSKQIKNHAFFKFANCQWEDVLKRRIVPPIIPDVMSVGDVSHFDAQKDVKPRKPFKVNGAMTQQGPFRGF
jgi:serine/threonine protein kinase